MSWGRCPFGSLPLFLLRGPEEGRYPRVCLKHGDGLRVPYSTFVIDDVRGFLLQLRTPELGWDALGHLEEVGFW